MSSLTEWKEKLKIKPVVKPQVPVKVAIPLFKKVTAEQEQNQEADEDDEEDQKDKEKDKEKEDKNPVKIITDIDTQFDREALKRRLQENKLAKVTYKKTVLEPVLQELEPPPTKAKKIKPTTEKPFTIQQQVAEEPLQIQGDMEEGLAEETLAESRKEADADNEEPVLPLFEKVEQNPLGSTVEPKVKKPKKDVTILGATSWVDIGKKDIQTRLPEPVPPVNIKVPSYYMNNREIFTSFVQTLFEPYRQEIESTENTINCDNIGTANGSVSLMTHQKVIRDYMNLYTPYRGLLLFHGLGSGKTCSSIAIAEGMKSGRRVIIMTPASLRGNYMVELKKCGDSLYKKNQFWEFISVVDKGKNKKVAAEADLNQVLDTLSSVLHLPKEFILKRKGAWMVDVTQPTNYATLSSAEKKSLDEQLDEMIQSKYTFINYNGIRRSKLAEMTNNFERNLFHDAVVIIDEAHNFISRITNKLTREKEPVANKRGELEHVPKALSLILYDQLLRANNCRVVLLTGTPIINYPNEIGVLFNILRGYIKTWEIPVTVQSKSKVSLSTFQEMFAREKILDYIEYSPAAEKLWITRNPFGFKNRVKEKTGYQGVTAEKKGDSGNQMILDTEMVDDATFEKHIVGILRTNQVEVGPTGITIHNYTALPDRLEAFSNRFIDPATRQVKNVNVFKRRILGLTSYFRSAQEDLLPRYEKTPEYFHVVHVPMSNHQFKLYEEKRAKERKVEKSSKSKKKVSASGIYEDQGSTYRIFSRLFCNFVMPDANKRPMPKEDEELSLEAMDKEAGKEDLTNAEEGEIEGDQILGALADKTYEARLQKALLFLKENEKTYLTPEALETYSPKMKAILENIEDLDHKGNHLIYTQFRTMEGIGIFKLVLEANGFFQMKIDRTSTGLGELDVREEDLGKPAFALYTGTETAEEKEIIRNIYNSTWDFIPSQIANALKRVSPNNNMGELCRILMITSSGSEGINLRNTRYVHIMEPYWHPVRMEQVIGRAIRICSHKDLPPEYQTVEVFVYLMALTEEQKKGDASIELKLNDLSKREPHVPLTSDEALYEICTIKEEVNAQLVRAVKETAIDCPLYSKKSKEGLQCVQFVNPKSSKFATAPDLEKQPDDTTELMNQTRLEWTGKPVNIEGVKYVARKTGKNMYEIYDLESYQNAADKGQGAPRQVGTLELKDNGDKIFRRL